MKVQFLQTISMLECFSLASKCITGNIKNSSTGTKDIVNDAMLRNRIIEYTVINYNLNNYFQVDIINDEYRASHHGLNIGDKRIIKGGMSDKQKAIHLREARNLALKFNITLKAI